MEKQHKPDLTFAIILFGILILSYLIAIAT